MRIQEIKPLPGYEPLVGTWLWAFENSRQRTLRTLEGFEPNLPDWLPSWGGNPISALLYHLAAIEADWLFTDILEKREFPPHIEKLFPLDVRDGEGNLTTISEVSMETHLQRLTNMREHFMKAMRTISDEDFKQPRIFPDYRVTPEWVIHHLMQHEAEHRGQIMDIREAFEHR